MNVVFTDVDAYLAELTQLRAADKLSIVRCSIERVDLSLADQGDQRSSGMQFIVVSGFHDDRYFYQGMFDCGTAFGRSDEPQRKAAEAMVEKIRATCGEIGIDCRSGLWQRP